jgi:acyl-CoA thioester hydrolase
MPQPDVIPVQIRFNDLDPLNHVNNVAYFSLMEVARVEFLRTRAKALFGQIVAAHNECDYRSEIRGGTRTVDISVSIERVGNSSFTVLHEIRVGDLLVAVGRTVEVTVGADRRPRPITDDERRLLTAD